MSRRWIITLVVLLAAAITALVGRNLYPPAPAPEDIELRPVPPAIWAPSVPFEPPVPEPQDEPPALVEAVCHCGTPYGPCAGVRQAARLHALHDHDLIGRGCASEDDEDHALWKTLRRPEFIELNGRNALAMADRAAYRERTR